MSESAYPRPAGFPTFPAGFFGCGRNLASGNNFIGSQKNVLSFGNDAAFMLSSNFKWDTKTEIYNWVGFSYPA